MTEALRAKVVSGLFWSAVQSWGQRIIAVVVFSLVARLVHPADLGLFAFVSSILGFTAILADQGLSEAVVQRPNVTRAQISAIFLVNVGVAFSLAAGLWLFAPLIAKKVALPGVTNVLRVTSIGLCIGSTYFSQSAMLRRAFQYRWLAIVSFVSSVGAGVLALILAYLGFGVWSLVAQSLAASVVTGVMLWAMPQWRISLRPHFDGIRAAAGYGLNRLGSSLLDYANNRYIEFFVLTALGPTTLGLYSVGMRLQQSLMQALSGAVLDVAHNAFSRLASDRVSLLQAYYRARTITAAVVVPLFVLVAAAAPELTLTLFGPNYADSALVLRPMALLATIQVVQFYNGTLINASGRPSLTLMLLIAKTFITVGALWLARSRGLQGLVLAFVVSQLLTAPASFYLVRWMLGTSFKVILLRTWRFLAGCGVSWLAVHVVRQALAGSIPSPLFRTAVLMTAGGLTYCAFVALVARESLTEIIHSLKRRSI